MKEYSVVMALVDFLPVIFFLVGAVILQRFMYDKMYKGQFALFAAGTIDVVTAGGLKALYKLLYALGICDFGPLNTLFFPLQSIGFLLAGFGIIAYIFHGREKNLTMAVAPPLWTGTFLFVGIMCAGLALLDSGLVVYAVRKKKPGIIVLVVISFFCCLCMGYLSSKNFDRAIFNWMAEGINVAGQFCFMIAAILLNKVERETNR